MWRARLRDDWSSQIAYFFSREIVGSCLIFVELHGDEFIMAVRNLDRIRVAQNTIKMLRKTSRYVSNVFLFAQSCYC